MRMKTHDTILDAAEALIAERGQTGLNVELLAQRAGVARRTVFNHFCTLDDVILTVASRTIEQVIESVHATAPEPGVEAPREHVFDWVARVLRDGNLPEATASLHAVLGVIDENSSDRQRQFVALTFDRATTLLTRIARERYPDQDPFELELLVTTLVHGVGVVAREWVATTDREGPRARAVWDDLVDRLIRRTESGYSVD